MSQLNFNMNNRKGKHLTYEERIKLGTLYKLGVTTAYITEQIGGRFERTIRREVAKGMVQQLNFDLTTRMQYSTEIGQSEHDKLATAKGPTLKIGKEFKLVEYRKGNW